jgi:hypothetical protein
MSDTADENGFDDVVAEILTEAQRRREAGEFPEELLAEIDEEFRRWAPIAYRQRGLEDAIRAVEAASFIEVDAPLEGSRPGVVPVKQVIKKATAWYHLHLARQVTALGVQVARPLRLLAEKVEGLDGRVARLETVAPLPPEAGRLVAPPTDEMVAAVHRRLEGAPARIVVGDVDVAPLVERLAAAGLDVYGADSSADVDGDTELRAAPLIEHLAAVPDDVLGGVVMVGLEGRLAPEGARRLVELAIDRVRAGGTVVVIAADPEEWRDTVGPVGADLAPGRAFVPETWAHLLAAGGCHVELTACGWATLVVGTVN